MNAFDIVKTQEYQVAFLGHLSNHQGKFVLHNEQEDVKSDYYFNTSAPSDLLHDEIIRKSRCFFSSSTGILCLFSDESLSPGEWVIFVDNESCIIPVGTNPFNIIHQIGTGALELEGVADLESFIRCCESAFGVIDWSEEREKITLYLSHFDNGV